MWFWRDCTWDGGASDCFPALNVNSSTGVMQPVVCTYSGRVVWSRKRFPGERYSVVLASSVEAQSTRFSHLCFSWILCYFQIVYLLLLFISLKSANSTFRILLFRSLQSNEHIMHNIQWDYIQGLLNRYKIRHYIYLFLNIIQDKLLSFSF